MPSEYLTSVRAAEAAGVSRRALFTLAGRARAAGVELHAPRESWPDQRTPLWDGEAIASYLASRPGRGANLRRPTEDQAEDQGAEVAHCAGQLELGEHGE